jgi:hypothetical protein
MNRFFLTKHEWHDDGYGFRGFYLSMMVYYKDCFGRNRKKYTYISNISERDAFEMKLITESELIDAAFATYLERREKSKEQRNFNRKMKKLKAKIPYE